LPEQQRLAIFLRYVADLDYRGIALVLGLKVGTVSATLHAAHERLRYSIQEVRR
jgi:DNA-directed RNA polymerase specialized sigma24 family protein